MSDLYRTRRRTGLRRRRARMRVPAKFRDGGEDLAPYDSSNLSADMHMMSHDLSLTDYAHIYASIHCGLGTPDEHNIMTSDEVVTTILTQFHVSKGLKVFGQEGANAVLKELKQLHDRMVMTPVSSTTISKQEKQAALQYLMFLKKKRSGKIKGRGCADGRKQRLYASKDNVSSPTVATEALLLTCLIDAMEHQDVATVDIPGAFMQSDMEEIHGKTTHMKLEGRMVDILNTIDPSLYKKHTKVKNGKKVIYVRLDKALYGTIQESLLFGRISQTHWSAKVLM